MDQVGGNRIRVFLSAELSLFAWNIEYAEFKGDREADVGETALGDDGERRRKSNAVYVVL